MSSHTEVAMKKNKKENKIIFHRLAILALLAFSLINTSNIPAQEMPTAAPLAEITPENVQDLKLLHWFGQGSFGGSIAQSADGQTLAALTESGIALFDGEDGTQNGFIPIGIRPTALTVSPDGTQAAVVVNIPTGEQDPINGDPKYEQQIYIYALPEGTQETAPISDLNECAGSNIWNIAFTADGTQLIFERKHAGDGDYRFCRIPLESGQPSGTYKVPTKPAIGNSMAIAPNGETVAVIAEHSNTVAVYDSANFDQIYEFPYTASGWADLLYAPSGRAIAVRTSTGENPDSHTLQIWDLANGETLYSGTPALKFNEDYDHYDMVFSFEISQDRRSIYLGTQFGYIAILDGSSDEPVKQIGPYTGISHFQSGNPGGATIAEIPISVANILLNPQETHLIASEELTGIGQSGNIHFLQLPDGNEFASIQSTSTVSESIGFAFSPDSANLAMAQSSDGAVGIYATQDGRAILELNGHTGLVNQIAYTPDGTIIATASDDNSVRLWDAQSGELLHTLNGHQRRVTRVAFAPDSSWLVSGADDNTLRVWNTSDGKLLNTLELGDENWAVDFLSVLDDNTSVIYRIMKYPSPFIGFIQEQTIWNTTSGQLAPAGAADTFITQFTAGSRDWFSGYSYNSPGRIVGELSENGSMKIAAAFNSPYGNGQLVTPVLAPNHHLVMSGNGFGLHAWELSDDGSFNFLGLTAADQMTPKYGEEYRFSPDGKFLAFTSGGGVVYLMGVPAK